MAPTSTRSRRRSLGLVIIGALAVAAVAIAEVALRGAGTALADSAITLTPTSGPPGTGVQVSGSGFPAGTTVTLLWDRTTQIGLATPTSSGAITSFFTVPQGASAGAHSVQAVALPPGATLPPSGTATPGPYSPPPGASPGAIQRPVGSAGVTFTVTSGTATPTPSATPVPLVTPIPSATPSAAPSASPSPSPSGTPSPTPQPSPAPTPQPFGLSLLDMAAPCIPEAGQSACDTTRARLWTADLNAWTEQQASAGQPAPNADDAFKLAFAMRVTAGDPAAVSAVARGMDWPHLRVTGARFRGTAASGGDWVEVKNVGGAPQEMTGWSVRVGDGGARFQFEDGYTLVVGAGCRVSIIPPEETPTGTPRPCAGALIAGDNLLPDDSGVIQLWVDYFDLKVTEVRYNSDASRQPPPPNLQGVRE